MTQQAAFCDMNIFMHFFNFPIHLPIRGTWQLTVKFEYWRCTSIFLPIFSKEYIKCSKYGSLAGLSLKSKHCCQNVCSEIHSNLRYLRPSLNNEPSRYDVIVTWLKYAKTAERQRTEIVSKSGHNVILTSHSWYTESIKLKYWEMINDLNHIRPNMFFDDKIKVISNSLMIALRSEVCHNRVHSITISIKSHHWLWTNT